MSAWARLTVSLRIPKKPDMGSLAEVSGRASMRAPEEMTRRYRGQPSSISTPFAYRVPSANCFVGDIDASIAGTYSGGCYKFVSREQSGVGQHTCVRDVKDLTCKSASMHNILSPCASLKPRTTALLRPRSVVRTMMRTL